MIIYHLVGRRRNLDVELKIYDFLKGTYLGLIVECMCFLNNGFPWNRVKRMYMNHVGFDLLLFEMYFSPCPISHFTALFTQHSLYEYWAYTPKGMPCALSLRLGLDEVAQQYSCRAYEVVNEHNV